ncbi:hypothetical protein GCM10017044_04110 [Kordiimonas sediminis]|uniref:Uncharacterized protein n=1 Tax=Kordiimonas sediminis TaxID=1735581 RepID=A0A919E4N6_9PROT|nr:hypothetical protein [Kordiimonas sediminis]GHF13304.1 hypothetical protein GCM10017044_04110 [Kordiimonas sediminis]
MRDFHTVDLDQEYPDYPLDILSKWVDVLLFYANDWDAIFEKRPTYFTQEFWYLLVGCVLNKWQGTPLTVSAAAQMMKTGSNRTREERIKKAEQDRYIIKTPSPADGRVMLVLPSPKLEALMRRHLSVTIDKAMSALKAD